MKQMKSTALRGTIVLLIALVVSIPAAVVFIEQWEQTKFVKGEGVTRTGTLGDYFEGIKGTFDHPPFFVPIFVPILGKIFGFKEVQDIINHYFKAPEDVLGAFNIALP